MIVCFYVNLNVKSSKLGGYYILYSQTAKLSLHRKEHPKDEVDLLKGEKANRTLSDSGISLGEVEVTIPNKQRPKKFEKPTHTAASSKVDTKSDKLRLDTEESNLENHSVSSGSETKRFEEPHNKITAKGVKKSGNGKGKKDKTTSINEIDKVEDLDEEVSPAKKTKRPKIVSVKQNSNLSKNKQEERPLITCSEAEGKKYNINKAYDGKKAQKVNQRKVSDVSENEEEDEEASTCTPSSSDNEDTDNEDDVNEEQSNAKNKLETNKTKNQPRKKVIRTRKVHIVSTTISDSLVDFPIPGFWCLKFIAVPLSPDHRNSLQYYSH